MATSDLREELDCSICLDLYKDPISLKCGHNFCRDCIVTVLDTQNSGHYSCPECRRKYTERPLLENNRKLCSIVERFRSTHREETEVLCTYCDPPVPATKSCLHCEASYCNKHLSNHSKSADHILTEPTTSFEDRKCSTHKEILKYYCTEDEACICMSCWVAGDHKGHQVELLNEAYKIKDPLTVLKKEMISDDIIPGSGDITSDVRDAGCLDEGMISQMLHRGLLHFTDSLIDLSAGLLNVRLFI